ncbi:MAG: ATP-grasp domain-containing protein [Promethearchaeota archaeon]|nr:MAG: ATP-grasp domain-containing protein [Candidatus Lokiarchaeota archaeon]
MTKNLIFIFEFVSGGGFSQADIPTSLFCEGFGMLRSIIKDFKALDFEIYTLLDYRIFFLSKILDADVIKKIHTHENYLKVFKNFVRECKYVFIIAPETSNILFELTKIAKNFNKIILSTNLSGIKLGTSKIRIYNFFKKNEILTPRTYRIPYKEEFLDFDFIIHKYRKLNGPIVIKPEDGVGAESVYYFENENQISDFFKEFYRTHDKNQNFILQEFIEGKDSSISLIGSPNLLGLNPIILTVNSQDINIKNLKSEYLGGYTPLENYKEILGELSVVMKKINFSKIEGYFGIDFIEKYPSTLYFIEINPRLTTSYIGLRNVINLNCAELILNSKTNDLKSTEIKILNHSHFTRVDFNITEFKDKVELYEDVIPSLMKKIPEFVTPPISLNNSEQFSSFIATKTKDLTSSRIRVNEIIQSLKDLNFKVVKPI